jgi:hypothetical protein
MLGFAPGLTRDTGAHLDVNGGDTDFLALGGNILRGQHGGVGLRHGGEFSIKSFGRAADSQKTRLDQP